MTQMTQMTQGFHSSARGRGSERAATRRFGLVGRRHEPAIAACGGNFTTTVEGFSRVSRRRGELSYLGGNRLWYKSTRVPLICHVASLQ